MTVHLAYVEKGVYLIPQRSPPNGRGLLGKPVITTESWAGLGAECFEVGSVFVKVGLLL